MTARILIVEDELAIREMLTFVLEQHGFVTTTAEDLDSALDMISEPYPPRFDKPYYHTEIKKMMDCGSEAWGFATYQCLSCGKGQHTVNFSCKGKACPQCGKRYSRESMEKIASRLLPGVRYRQV